MIKNNKGITLITLVITVIVLLILATTGITAIRTSMNQVKDDQLNTELGIVRQAIIEQYALAEAVEKIKVPENEPQVSFWIGTRIHETDLNSIAIPTNENINPNDKNAPIFTERLKEYHPQFQEDFYYRLNPEELKKIGIHDASDDYLVNYGTAEVYNETKQMTSNAYLLYLPSTVYDSDSNEKSGDEESFNDWKN